MAIRPITTSPLIHFPIAGTSQLRRHESSHCVDREVEHSGTIITPHREGE